MEGPGVPTPPVAQLPDNVCQSCATPTIEPDYAFPLCTHCRDNLSRPSLPGWVWTVAVAALLMVALALGRFPRAVDSALAFERGQRAERSRHYVTALHQYEKALAAYPDSTLILARACIARYHDSDYPGTIKDFERLEGREVDSQKLKSEVEGVMDSLAVLYAFSKDLTTLMESTKGDPGAFMLAGFVARHPDDQCARYLLANALFDEKKYDQARSLALELNRKHPELAYVVYLLAAISREQGDYDQCRQYCSRMLELNAEDSYAYKSLAEIELKQRHDQQALELAQKAYAYEPRSGQILAVLALAYHYNGDTTQRDRTYDLFVKQKDFSRFKPDQLRAIFEGRVNWR